MIKLSPSVLACDFSKLGEEAVKAEKAGARLLHLDVMDGMFVPNLSFGAPVIKMIRKCTPILFDVHLMITQPLRYIDDFADAGADIITFHVEAGSPIKETVEKIRERGCVPSLCVKPSTDIGAVFPYLDDIGMVLIMTVEPGFGGQKFMPEMMPKVKALREECNRRGIDLDIEVDGGINEQTAAVAVSQGANVLVAGSSFFGADDYADAAKKITGTL